MEFNGKQLSALVKLGIAMAAADGRIADEENVAISFELAKFGVSVDEAGDLLATAQAMSPADALITISALNNEQKKYATGYLAAIMAADGEIADSEVKLWQLICTLGGFPSMNIRDALLFWKNN